MCAPQSPDDERLVEPQAPRAALVLPRQRVVGGDGRHHPIAHRTQALVVEQKALPTPREALDAVRVEAVGLDELAGGIARRERREQRALLLAVTSGGFTVRSKSSAQR